MEHFPAYNSIDIVAAVLVLAGLVQGLIRGMSREAAGLVSVVVAVWGSWFYYGPLGALVTAHTRLQGQEALALAFFLCLVLGLLIMFLLRVILRQVMGISFKGAAERLGGALAGAVRVAAMVAAALYLVALWPNDYVHQLFTEQSLAGRLVCRHGPAWYHAVRDRLPGAGPDQAVEPSRVAHDSQVDDRDRPDAQ